MEIVFYPARRGGNRREEKKWRPNKLYISYSNSTNIKHFDSRYVSCFAGLFMLRFMALWWKEEMGKA